MSDLHIRGLSNSTDIFRPNGPLASIWANYERRNAQVDMVRAVENTIDKGGVLLAEAGTGTGKTMAYLIPAILGEGTVIISTGTKNLQEQIFFKDIRSCEAALGKKISAVYLKGQDNYLCPRRLNEFLESPRVLSYPTDRIAKLSTWANSTQTGDRMEIDQMPDDDPVWQQVCSTRDTRIGSKCPFLSECFVNKARQKAMRAKIVVVNHHLYFADLATKMRGGSILPKHDTVIFDEAHLIEDTATEFFSVSVSSRQILRLVDDVKKAVKIAKFKDDAAEVRRPKILDSVKAISSQLFTLFRDVPGRIPLVPEELESKILNSYYRLDSALEAAQMSLKLLEGRDDIIDHCTERFDKIRGDLSQILTRTEKGYVHWIENRNRATILGASPIDISDILRQWVFFNTESVALVSATLSAGGDFSFLKKRLGLDFDVETISLKSPFDYTKQACLYLPRNISDPRDTNFAEQVADETFRLIELTRGGALVLCTSVRNMKAIHESLQDRDVGPLLLQGEAPKTILIDLFLKDKSSVLCATASFWQGVDLPGDALRLVVIDKLPFASPGEPLVAARISYLKEQGHNPFIEYQVPAAALALKQGFGRLIRTKKDAGIVAILDMRLHTKHYAKVFLNSLPDCPRYSDIEDVKAWWTDRL